ncbi:MAG: PQQ-binding-like beta-propeller repeat protein [Lentisphaerae bacterium]|nr:PQQ-binding-like beta-propeller repeat protein [Lentisphaerota bacterium]
MTRSFPRRGFSFLSTRVLPHGQLRGAFQCMALGMCLASVAGAQAVVPAATPAAPAGLTGGLVVQLGTADTQTPIALGRTGRYLVHVLGVDGAGVAAAQTRCRAEGVYGLVSVEEATLGGKLPYTENLVNLVIVDAFAVPARELFRVVTPNGAVLVRQSGLLGAPELVKAGFKVTESQGMPLIAVKPWPEEMDVWSHPRHGADGNAVSGDTLVGPPARIRWVAGALSEVEGLVSAGGRNFYGGILARDSFNGLRLWHRSLRKAETNAAPFRLSRNAHNRARPIASDAFVFVAEKNRLVALGAADGQPVRTFDGIVRPTDVVHCEGTVVVCGDSGVNAYQANTGALLWSHSVPGPRNLAADQHVVSFVHGRPARGETVTAAVVGTSSGAVRWQRSDYPWLKQVRRVVLRGELIAYELSSFNDHDAGNSLHVLSTATGDLLWEKDIPPGMNHARQTRAMFVDDDLWILHGGKTNTADPKQVKRLPIQISSLDPRTGKIRTTHPAGLAHCFPPVATRRFLLSGVMDFTDLTTGELIVNPITKANCSRENGWVPGNGLVYTTPKHCTCWPILRGFVALAPAKKGGKPITGVSLALHAGPAKADADAAAPGTSDWPLYRHDRWRSAGTPAAGPQTLTRRWSVSLAGGTPAPAGPIQHDWRDNEFVKGPVSPPTVAYDRVYVARPDAHEVVALDAATGVVSWRFTANGRVDTPPALYRGLCLFGSRAGSVYALRADNGALVWRLQVGAEDERVVAYGQLESAWPVPGAVLISNDVAYFAAGRQPLADGGIFVFAVDPVSGRQLWRHQLDTIPQKGFYENSGLEFDSFDILHQEGDGIGLSRWVVSKDGKTTKVDKWNAFARLDTGGGGVWVPRGCWTYGPRHQDRFRGEAPRRPLCAFQGRTLISSLNGTTTLFRRDFDFKGGEAFKSSWITGWEAAQTGSKGGNPFRTNRLAEKARWQRDPFNPEAPAKPEARVPGKQMYNSLQAMVLAGDGRVFVIHKDGPLRVVKATDGTVHAEATVPSPAWDGLAIANRRLYLTTQAGDVLCIGD